MRLHLSFVILSCIIATLWSSGTPDETAQQREILAVRQLMASAAQKRDFTAWAEYVADDCVFSTDDGEIATKAEIIEHMRHMPAAYDRAENAREFLVHVYGHTAVLNFRQTVHELFTDTDIVTEMRHTQTFVKQSGQWRLMAEQWGALPINLRKPISASAGNYKEYAGQYEWRPGGPVDTVSIKEGRLFSRLSGESEDHEYKPLGSETFFIEDDLGSVRFIRNAQSRVVGYTYHRPDGQEIHVKKIN